MNAKKMLAQEMLLVLNNRTSVRKQQSECTIRRVISVGFSNTCVFYRDLFKTRYETMPRKYYLILHPL